MKKTPILTLASFITAGLTVHAQSIWIGDGADDNWSTGANWFSGSAPGTTAAYQFGGDTRLTPNNDMTGRTASSITFNESAGAFVVGGNGVNLGGNVVNLSEATQTIDLNLTMTGNRTFNTAVGDLVINGDIGQSGGSRRLFKEGLGTLTLAGNNTFDTVTGIYQGTLHFDLSQGGDFATPTFWIGNATSSVAMNNPIVKITAPASGTTTKNFDAIGLFGNSTGRIVLDANGGDGLEINVSGAFGTVTGNATYNVDLRSQDITVQAGDPRSLSNGVVRTGSVTDAVATGFASFDQDGYIQRFVPVNEFGTVAGTDQNLWASGDYTTGFTTANSLTITGAGSISGTSSMLNQAILMQEGSGDFTIGIQRMGSSSRLALFNYSTDGSLIMDSQMLSDNDGGHIIIAGPGHVLVSDQSASSFTGATYVQEGEFTVDGILARTGSVQVFNGAVLNGAGTIGTPESDETPAIIRSGGMLQASASAALNIAGGVDFEAHSLFRYVLDEAGGDALVAGGVIDLNGIQLLMTLDTVPVFFQSETILSGSDITGSFGSINGDAFGPGNTFTLTYDSVSYDFQLFQESDHIYVQAIPEPAGAVVVLLLLSAGFVLIRRRRQRG